MITLAVNGQNDLYLGDTGSLAVARDADALAQVLAQYVRTLQNELPFDVTRGMPNLTTVWRGVPNLPQYEAALRQRLLAAEGVRGIVSLETSRQGEAYSYVAVIRTVYGDIALNG